MGLDRDITGDMEELLELRMIAVYEHKIFDDSDRVIVILVTCTVAFSWSKPCLAPRLISPGLVTASHPGQDKK